MVILHYIVGEVFWAWSQLALVGKKIKQRLACDEWSSDKEKKPGYTGSRSLFCLIHPPAATGVAKEVTVEELKLMFQFALSPCRMRMANLTQYPSLFNYAHLWHVMNNPNQITLVCRVYIEHCHQWYLFFSFNVCYTLAYCGLHVCYHYAIHEV